MGKEPKADNLSSIDFQEEDNSDGSRSKIFDPSWVRSISLLVSEISQGRVKKYLGQREVSLLFTTVESMLVSGKGPSPEDSTFLVNLALCM